MTKVEVGIFLFQTLMYESLLLSSPPVSTRGSQATAVEWLTKELGCNVKFASQVQVRERNSGLGIHVRIKVAGEYGGHAFGVKSAA